MRNVSRSFNETTPTYIRPMLKEPKPFPQQVELLKSRGMIIEDDHEIELYLNARNYYRLNVYFHYYLTNENKFKENTCFSMIINHENNDSWLRKFLRNHLEPIELKARTQIAYWMAHLLKPDAFYHSSSFYEDKSESADDKFCAVSQIIESIKEKYSRDDRAIQHHMAKYEGVFPTWVVVEYLSFGDLSKIYSWVQGKVQIKVAENFNTKAMFLKSWFHCLSVLRNVCAHYGYLYKRRMPNLPKIPEKLNSEIDRHSLFANVFCLYRLSSLDCKESIISSLWKRETQNESFHLSDYGFPHNWETVLRRQL